MAKKLPEFHLNTPTYRFQAASQATFIGKNEPNCKNYLHKFFITL